MSDSVLSLLADNPALFEAIKAVLLNQLKDIKAPEGASDELLGQMVRAQITGRQCIEDAFKEIAKHKTQPAQPARSNPAR